MAESVIVNIENNTGPINVEPKVSPNPGLVATIINALADHASVEVCMEEVPPLFEIQDKINHNNLVEYKYLIEEYYFYAEAIADTYNILEEDTPEIRSKITTLINRVYRGIKNKKLSQSSDAAIDTIRLHCDVIIRETIEELRKRYFAAANVDSSKFLEDIDAYIGYIVGEAFVNCKVLENPNDS